MHPSLQDMLGPKSRDIGDIYLPTSELDFNIFQCKKAMLPGFQLFNAEWFPGDVVGLFLPTTVLLHGTIRGEGAGECHAKMR